MKERISIKNISKTYTHKTTSFKAINDISFDIHKGQTVGLIGESGSGKSTIAKIIMQLEKPDTGKVLYNDKDIYSFKDQLYYRKKVQMVFQNPYTALNPRMNIQQILNEPLNIHSLKQGQTRLSYIHSLLERVQLDKDILNKFPHEISGGQSQRICIARALSIEPDFLICDESLSALDLSVQAEIMNLLNECQRELNLGVLFISHDLRLVNYISDVIFSMENGQFIDRK